MELHWELDATRTLVFNCLGPRGAVFEQWVICFRPFTKTLSSSKGAVSAQHLQGLLCPSPLRAACTALELISATTLQPICSV